MWDRSKSNRRTRASTLATRTENTSPAAKRSRLLFRWSWIMSAPPSTRTSSESSCASCFRLDSRYIRSLQHLVKQNSLSKTHSGRGLLPRLPVRSVSPEEERLEASETGQRDCKEVIGQVQGS